MNTLQRALRPASRRIMASSARPVAASTTPAARRASSHDGPFDPAPGGEMGVGELEGARFKIEPLRRTGEDPSTTRARLIYQSRKRGTLESDLLLSTFAAQHLPAMAPALMAQYDRFLDENDWDIYYWATQDPPPPESPSSSSSDAPAGTAPAGMQGSEPYMEPARPGKGEWAQTIGTFRPAYRPVPARWRGSEILERLRMHVKERSAAGVLGNTQQRAEGMAFMPALGERK